MLRNVTSYERPTSIEDAVALAQSMPNAAYVGGGAWTTAQADPEIETLIDLQDVHPSGPLRGVDDHRS